MLAGKYRVERILGRGGMGVVVEARHIALDERVALKFLLPESALHPDAAARFLREARAAFKIKGEHVARVSDVGTLETGAPYMVMELLVGDDLAAVLRERGPLPLHDAVDFVIQACEAIAEAHSHGIVHRDLKPPNLFLTRRPDGSPLVKVLDFGISKDVKGASVEKLTRTGMSMGSALYMSPEQMKETRSVDHRTDIYSLGISLFELLAGRQPFFADSLPQLVAAVLTGKPTPLRDLRPDLPEGFAAALARAYERPPDQRYASIAELVLALAPFAPARSGPTIERIARMGGFVPPVDDGPAPPYRPAMGSQPGIATAPTDSAPIAAPAGSTPIPTPAGSTPIPAPPPGSAFGAPGHAPRGAPSGPSPAPATPPPVTHLIVPGPYAGPSRARAAATFASGRVTGAGLQGGRARRSALTLAAIVAGALVLGLAAGAITLRQRRAADDPGSASPAQPPPALAQPEAPAVPASAPAIVPAPVTAQEVRPAAAPSASAASAASTSASPSPPQPRPPSTPVRPPPPPPRPTSQPSPGIDLNNPN
ncbi:MAG: protein kinase [Polyangiaceae bacterium]|nr:protein kinase [Polyangiaceae bacterium]